MILKYDEAKALADNPDWFEQFYNKEDLATDEQVDEINKLVSEVGEDKLHEYFCIDEDMTLQKEYVEDIIDYLNSFKK